MNLDQITSQLEARYIDWGYALQSHLDAVSENPVVAKRIVRFIEEAANHPVVAGKPGLAVAHCLKLSAAANFRFGLLMGILLNAETEPDHKPPAKTKPCLDCDETGRICFRCYLPAYGCQCGEEGFDPVICEACGGSGRI